MKPNVSITPQAENDLKLAYQWYEEQHTGLGEDFLLCVEAGLSQIQTFPNLNPEVEENIRRNLIRRFPYGIFYIIDNNIITVLAVLHFRRNPKEWKKRL
ncbi:MAG: type II toxin-antitoxin system RelE/ParE family toxin [bacterium]|nr:type II toxin-antitoxin system RelE/ParE family toxin [bacterium]